MKPTFNRIVLLPDEPPETVGSIHIPEKFREGTGAFGKGISATVISCGPGYQHPKSGVFIKNEIPVGVKVLVKKYAGTEVVLNGVRHMVVTDDDIEAIIG